MPNVKSCCKNCQRYPVLSILQQAPTLEMAKLPDISHDVVRNGSTIWKWVFYNTWLLLAELSKIIRIWRVNFTTSDDISKCDIVTSCEIT